MKPALTLIKLSGTSGMAFLLCFGITSAASFVSILPDLLIGYVINILSNSSDKNAFINTAVESVSQWLGSANLLLVGLGFFLTTAILTALLRDLSGYCATRLSENLLHDIRSLLYAKLTRIRYQEYITTTKGQAINVVMNDSARLSLIFERPFYTLLADLFDLIWIAAFLALIDVNILLILLCAVPIIYVASIKTGKVQKQIADRVRTLETQLTEKVEQTISGYEVMKSLNAEDTEIQNFRKELQSSLVLRLNGARNLARFFPIEGCLRAIAITTVGVYIIGQVHASALSVGMVAVGILYANKFFAPIKNLSLYYQMIQKGIVAAEKIVDFLKTPDEQRVPDCQIKDQACSPAAADNSPLRTTLSVRNLGFSLNGKTIFSGVSFDCHSGNLVLVKGSSGAGKTSFFRLLLGFHEVPDGCILINHQDINTYDRQRLRSEIAYVSQKPFLHNDTVVRNIGYPRMEIQDTRLHDTLALLNLTHLAHSDLHYEEGKNLSGGEMARIAFARAILRTPRILLLDETIASLDATNTACIMAAIENITRNGTIVLMATHNNDTHLLDKADTIIQIS